MQFVRKQVKLDIMISSNISWIHKNRYRIFCSSMGNGSSEEENEGREHVTKGEAPEG